MRVLSKIKYKRDKQGRIALMDKETFKKLYGFSPDRFDGAIHTFFRDDPTKEEEVKAEDLQVIEAQAFMAQGGDKPGAGAYSSM